MTKRDALEVAVKILGLYSLFTFLGSTLVVTSVLLTQHHGAAENGQSYILLSCLTTLLYLALAVVCLLQGRWVAERLTQDAEAGSTGERAAVALQPRLSLWVRILGLYFFVSSTGQFFSALVEAWYMTGSLHGLSRLVGQTLQIIFSLMFIFRSERVAQFVERMAGEGRGE